jgi:CheY-like chemotaxis protein
MIEPLALILYEKLLPGTQLVNRLQDLKYRVQTLGEAGKLVECAEQVKPMLVLVDLESGRNDVCAALGRLRQNPATQHLCGRDGHRAASRRTGRRRHLNCHRRGDSDSFTAVPGASAATGMKWVIDNQD